MPTFTDKEQYQNIENIKPEPSKFQALFNKVITASIIVILLLSGYFMYLVVTASGQLFENTDASCNNFFCTFQNGLSNVPKIFSTDTKLKGQDQGRTNVLLMGVDTTGSLGLTDTLILTSIYHTEKKVVTINIPRDFLVDYNNERFKINELYGRAEALNKGQGAKELTRFLEREFGVEIPYWVIANFDGTKKMIDVVGGIDINVENSFTDCEFPTNGYTGYLPCQNFVKGIQKMAGDRALVFARSRHGDNGEGSDFARSKRQSMVIQSTLQRVKSQNLFDNITKLSDILTVLGTNVKTNLNPSELKSMFNISRQINLTTSFLRVNWAVGNGILCDDSSTDEEGYFINYCDNQVAGTKTIPNKARIRAKNVMQNLSSEAEFDKIADSPILIFGNGAKSPQKIYDTLDASGFSNITINNTYTKIPVTPTPEKISIYLLDTKLKTQIDSSIKNSINYNLVETSIENLPSNVILPKNVNPNNSANNNSNSNINSNSSNTTAPKVIIWIE